MRMHIWSIDNMPSVNTYSVGYEFTHGYNQGMHNVLDSLLPSILNLLDSKSDQGKCCNPYG